MMVDMDCIIPVFFSLSLADETEMLDNLALLADGTVMAGVDGWNQFIQAQHHG